MRLGCFFIWLGSLVSLSYTRAVIETRSPSHANPCPNHCTLFNAGPSGWTSFSRLEDLDKCDQPLLFDYHLHDQAAASKGSKTQVTIQACMQSADKDETAASSVVKPRDTSAGAAFDTISSPTDCGAAPKQIPVIAHVGSRLVDPLAAGNPKDISAAARQLASYIQTQAPCDTTTVFAKVGESILGLYSGAEIEKPSAADLINLFQAHVLEGAQTFQVCEPGGTPTRTFGLFAGSVIDAKDVQDAIMIWRNSQCLDTLTSIPIYDLSIGTLSRPLDSTVPWHTRKIVARDTTDIATCSPDGATYSSEEMPAGSYMEWGLVEQLENLTTGRQYITIVNLTPHRFKLESTHSYQMDVFDWGDIPPGRARQNIAHYTEKVGANHVDDNGEAYYTIEGTNKRFVIRATTHSPDSHSRRTVIDLTGMGMGQREYLDPRPEVPVTLVITGSESYGFTASLSHGQGNWMRKIYDVIKDREIQHIVIPGSHDAGMSTISNQIVSLGSAANTQTQALNIYNQLRVGARWFDLRIMSVHQTDSEADYQFWVAHVNDETADVPVGNTGESLDDVINEINQFTSENPGEIVFLRIRYLVGIRRIPAGGPIYWSNDIANDFFNQLKRANNRCGSLDTTVQFQRQTASYFMDRNNGAGCVIFLLVGDHLQNGVPRASVVDGLYPAEQLAINDNWSNLADTQKMAEDQIADWSNIPRSSPFSKDQFLISQWLVSSDAITTTALTIQNIAILPTNPALYWAGVNNMSPTKWPNVLLVDYIGVVVTDQFAWEQLSAELYTLAIGLNLYMISENCDVNAQRSPVLPSVASSRSIIAFNSTQAWNGIIFANGTIVDHPPPNMHLGRVAMLKNGTVFNNGTTLTQDIHNPNYGSPLF